jgi:mono/diheme cytochrome c family protein
MKRGIGIFLILSVFFTGCIDTTSKTSTKEDTSELSNDPALTPEEQEVERGRILFMTSCKLCHGADGTQGLNGAKDLSTSKLTKDEKLHVIKNGRNAMAAYKNILEEGEINAISAFVETLKK